MPEATVNVLQHIVEVTEKRNLKWPPLHWNILIFHLVTHTAPNYNTLEKQSKPTSGVTPLRGGTTLRFPCPPTLEGGITKERPNSPQHAQVWLIWQLACLAL